MNTLFFKYPRLREAIPHIGLAELPTPVVRLERLGAELGIDSLYLKRDDISAPVYGGNKVRKLEILLAQAKALGKTSVLTWGPAGSNHVAATAYYSRQQGIHCIAVLFPQPVSAYVRRNLLVDLAMGAELIHSKTSYWLPGATLLDLGMRRLRRRENPFFIPPGGSSALATLGYVNAGFELAEQVAAGDLPEPDYVFCPYGSGGTAAGLMIGLRAAGLRSRVIAIAVVEKIFCNAMVLRRLANQTLAELRAIEPGFPIHSFGADDLSVVHDYFGHAYGLYTEAGAAAKQRIKQTEGYTLDGTYTGKTLSALIDWADRHGMQSRNLLMWNTYNSRDLTPLTDGVTYEGLPRPLQRYFTEERQPLDRD